MPALARGFAESGCPAVQLRLKRSTDRERLATQRAVAEALHGHAIVLCVDDRADLACVLRDERPEGPTAGLHVGADDLPPGVARDLVGTSVRLGTSTHDPAQLRAAVGEPVDYVAYGPVYGTRSKERPDPTVGLAGLRRAAEVVACPLVAIGGLDEEGAVAAREAGADAVAMISALYAGADPATASGRQRIVERAARLQERIG